MNTIDFTPYELRFKDWLAAALHKTVKKGVVEITTPSPGIYSVSRTNGDYVGYLIVAVDKSLTASFFVKIMGQHDADNRGLNQLELWNTNAEQVEKCVEQSVAWLLRRAPKGSN